MNFLSPDWSMKHKNLGTTIRKPDYFSESISTIIQLHNELHQSMVSVEPTKNPIDLLFRDLKKEEYSIMPTRKDETIAWSIWHIARIEDLTMNCLVSNEPQVFDESWLLKLNVDRKDTGNAMTDEEIIDFSKKVTIDELLGYRCAVGRKSHSILTRLNPLDMKRKVNTNGLARIFDEGGVINHSDSIWLLDFWSKKDIAGILMMPLTRHQTLHLNDCFKWKEAIRTSKKFFMS